MEASSRPTPVSCTCVTSQRIANVQKALALLKPCEWMQKIALFAQLYPDIALQRSRLVPEQDILCALNSDGLNLTQSEYRAMFNAERILRDSEGRRTCCSQCGTVLWIPFRFPDASTEPSNTADESTSVKTQP